MKKTIRAWAIVDIKESQITFVSIKKNNWYIAGSEKKRYKPVPCTITYSAPTKGN